MSNSSNSRNHSAAASMRATLFAGCAALILSLPLAACGSDDDAEPADREMTSELQIALAWDTLDPDEQQLLCGLTISELEEFLEGVPLAYGAPPEIEGWSSFLATVC